MLYLNLSVPVIDIFWKYFLKFVSSASPKIAGLSDKYVVKTPIEAAPGKSYTGFIREKLFY